MLFLLTKIKGWLIGLGAAIIAVLGAFLFGELSGKSKGKEDVREADQKASDKAVKNDLNLRQTIDAKVDGLPPPKISLPSPMTPQEPSDAQAIGNAQPGTAAGELQNDWLSKG